MPKGKTKKFIDKKNSVTFQLVHRSQRDPLAADETAPQRVLVPTGSKQKHQNKPNALNNEKRKEEQQKYGVFFDDEYDYLQHLKDVRTLTAEWERVEPENKVDNTKSNKKVVLPSSVFESNIEEKVGLLNRAATSGLQLDLDPDVVAAMDDDFDFDDPENELEDDFMQLANAEGDDDDNDDNDDDDDDYDDDYENDESDINDSFDSDPDDHISSGSEHTFGNEETKSRFTEYSMSSNIMKRNQGLTLLDDKFEQMYAGYDENEIGPLDCEDIEGFIESNSDILLQCAKEHENKQKLDTESVSELVKKHLNLEDEKEEDYDKYLEKLSVDVRERNKWDCESIISTYSNIYNHPKLIKETRVQKIKVDEKTGIPKEFSGTHDKNQLTVRNLSQFENTDAQNNTKSHAMRSVISEMTVRSKNETPEERKARQQMFKEYRRERRKERKINIEAFKSEKKRQEHILNNERKNIKANRIL